MNGFPSVRDCQCLEFAGDLLPRLDGINDTKIGFGKGVQF